MTRKEISVEVTNTSCLEKWQGQNTRADNLSDELFEVYHSIALLQNKLNEKNKYIKLLTLFPIKKLWTANKQKTSLKGNVA